MSGRHGQSFGTMFALTGLMYACTGARDDGTSHGGSAGGGTGASGVESGASSSDDGGDPTSSATSTTGGTNGSSGSSGASDGSGTSGTTGASDDGDGGLRFDLGADEGGSGAGEAGSSGCTKVDFLFVIDNSGSMKDEQTQLLASFPGFIASIQAAVQADDYQIMVINTDGSSIDVCDVLCGLGLPDCNGVACTSLPPPDTCATTPGAGKIVDLNAASCNLVGGRRFITSAEPDVNAAFQCVGQVGTSGNANEITMQCATAAVSPALTGPGGCNEGFLRDDAILVVSVITDEEDAPGQSAGEADSDANSPGDPATWKQAFVDAKQGQEGAIVVLALIGDTGMPGGLCSPLSSGGAGTGAEPAPRLRTFAESFSRGLWASVCASDYTPFFDQAVGLIDASCDDFVPPG